MKERAQLGAAEWANLILQCFLSLMEVAESWESVTGETLCRLTCSCSCSSIHSMETEHRDRGTLALTHCSHSYCFMTSEKPVATATMNTAEI